MTLLAQVGVGVSLPCGTTKTEAKSITKRLLLVELPAAYGNTSLTLLGRADRGVEDGNC